MIFRSNLTRNFYRASLGKRFLDVINNRALGQPIFSLL